jgi:hypothetical protein
MAVAALATGLVISAPIAFIDPETQDHYGDHFDQLAQSILQIKNCEPIFALGRNQLFGACRRMTAPVKVFGCRPFIDHCCPPRQGRRSKTSKEGNRESEGRRRRCDLWGFESCSRLLSSGRNDYQR